MALTLEQQRAIAVASARNRIAKPSAEEDTTGSGVAKFLKERVVDPAKHYKQAFDLAAIGAESLMPESVRSALNTANNWISENVGVLEKLPEGGLMEKRAEDVPEMIASPVTQAARGAASTGVGTAKLLSPEFSGRMDEASKLEKELVEEAGTGGYKTAGYFLDPAVLKIAKGAQKLMPYQKVTGSGALEGVKALTKNIAAGTGTGGVIGGLSEEGDLESGMMAGGVASTALPALLGTASKIGSAGKRILGPILSPEGLESSVGRTGRVLAGDKTDDIISALQRAKAGETAGQTTVPSGSAEFAALQRIADASRPSTAVAHKAGQVAKRQAMLERVKPDLESAIKKRAAVTTPIRETELSAANIAGEKTAPLTRGIAQKRESIVNALQNKGQLQTEAAQQRGLERGVRAKPYQLVKAQPPGATTGDRAITPQTGYPVGAGNVPGYPRIPSRYSPHTATAKTVDNAVGDISKIEAQRKAEKGLLQYQLDSLESHGLRPLKSEGIAAQVENTFNRKGLRVSDVVQDTKGYIQNKLSEWTKPDGTIDAYDLYGIRKDIGKTIKAFQKARGVYDKNAAAGLQRDVQKAIDDSIELSGGTEWKSYLDQYSKLSKPVEQSKIISEMQTTLKGEGGKERRGPFMTLIGRGEERLAKKGSDYKRYEAGDLDEMLTPRQNAVKKIVERQLDRDAKMEALASSGQSKALKMLRATEEPYQGPNFLNPKVTLTNQLLNRLQGMGGEKTTEELGRLMIEDPRKLGQLMEKAGSPAGSKIIDAILRSRLPQAYSAAGE